MKKYIYRKRKYSRAYKTHKVVLQLERSQLCYFEHTDFKEHFLNYLLEITNGHTLDDEEMTKEAG